MAPNDSEQDARRNRALGLQVMGLIALAVGVGLVNIAGGVIVAGVGLMLMGIAQELS